MSLTKRRATSECNWGGNTLEVIQSFSIFFRCLFVFLFFFSLKVLEMKLKAAPQCINKCEWGLKMHETEQWTGWKRGQLSSFLGFFLSLSLSFPHRPVDQQKCRAILSTFPFMKLLWTDLNHLSLHLTCLWFLHDPNLHLEFSTKNRALWFFFYKNLEFD